MEGTERAWLPTMMDADAGLDGYTRNAFLPTFFTEVEIPTS